MINTNYKDKNFVFFRCFCRSRGNGDPESRLKSLIDRFMLGSQWMPSLMYTLKPYFKTVSFVICIDDKYPYLCKTYDVKGVTLVITTVSEFKNLINTNCDVLFMRGGVSGFEPPKHVTSIYYGASTKIYPHSQDTWDAIISSKPEKDKNIHTWVKGSNKLFWKPIDCEKEYDFICLGRPGKSVSVVNRIAQMFPNKRILVTGIPKKQLSRNIEVVNWEVDHDKIRGLLRKSKWAIASASDGGEGFPMSIQLEYSLSGLPYVYDPKNVPMDGYYVNDNTSVSINRFNFDDWKDLSKSSRDYSEKYLTAQVSAESFIKILDNINKK